MELLQEWQEINNQLRDVCKLILKVQQTQELALKKLDLMVINSQKHETNTQ